MGRTQSRRLGRTVSAFAVSLMLGLTGLACAKSSKTEASDSTPFTNAPSTSSSTSTTAARKPCTDANLMEAATADYPKPTILDRTCSSAAAVATLESTKVPGGVGVAFFVNGDDGTWKLVRVWNIDDAAGGAPEGIPSSLVRTWRSNYEARKSAENTTTTSVDPNAPSLYEGEAQTTTTTTTAPPQECPPETPPDQCPTTTQPPQP